MLQSLVHAGHPLSDVLGYTLAQVQWWAAAVSRQRASDQAAAVVAARMAWADQQAVRDYLRSLGAI